MTTPPTRQPSMQEEVFKLLKTGASLLTIAQKYPNFNYAGCIENFRAIHVNEKRPLVEPLVIWIYGPPKTGKSHLAHNLYPNPYYKDSRATSIWWDDYMYQDYVIIDQLLHDHVFVGHLLSWLQKWPVRVQIKCGYVPLLATRFCLISYEPPSELLKPGSLADSLLQRVAAFDITRGSESILEYTARYEAQRRSSSSTT